MASLTLSAIAELVESGDTRSALRAIRSLWSPELEPGLLAPLYGLWARSLCEVGQLDRSLKVALRSCEEFPDSADAWTALGNVHEARDELEASLCAFERSVELAPQSQLAHYNLGALLERHGDDRRAEKLFRTALQGEEGLARLSEAAAALGSLLRRQDRLADAERVYDDYLQDDPLDVPLLVEHGVCLSELGSLEAAQDRFEEAVALEPDHAGASYNLGVIYERIGRNADAIEVMKRAHELDPTNSLTQAVLGGWILRYESELSDWGMQLIYCAQDTVIAQYEAGILLEHHACMVMEEIFEALWHSGRRRAARETAKAAGRRDWITPHILETLNRQDHGPKSGRQLFQVSARAVLRKNDERPLVDFPSHIDGYTTDMTVVANDEEEARAFSLSYLKGLDPAASLELVVREQAPRRNSLAELSPTRGVAQVTELCFFSKRSARRS